MLSARGALMIATLACLLPSTGAEAQEPPLIRLPGFATSPVIGALKSGKVGPMGRETNIGGWLVLNGARFLKSDFPELAKTLDENYAAQGYKFNDPNFTRLPAEQRQSRPDGEVFRGFAICPSTQLRQNQIVPATRRVQRFSDWGNSLSRM